MNVEILSRIFCLVVYLNMLEIEIFIKRVLSRRSRDAQRIDCTKCALYIQFYNQAIPPQSVSGTIDLEPYSLSLPATVPFVSFMAWSMRATPCPAGNSSTSHCRECPLDTRYNLQVDAATFLTLFATVVRCSV
jgi:hypothetical protein